MLTADVMTPHMDQWYEKGGKIGESGEELHRRIPADWHDPVPVPFLVVQKAKLLVGIAPRRPEFAGELPQVFAALKQALDWLGAGPRPLPVMGVMGENAGAMASLRENAEQDREREADRNRSPQQRALRALQRRFETDRTRR